MAELATIARPYAEALFRVTQQSDPAAWSGWLRALAQTARLPEVLSLASDPKVSRAQVGELLLAALSSASVRPPVEQTAQQFVQTVVDNHRLAALPEISAQYDTLKNVRDGAADASIVSAFPLDGQLLAELVAKLEQRFGRRLKPLVTVDASLIGGVRVTVGDEVLDTSVRAQLARMQTALTA